MNSIIIKSRDDSEILKLVFRNWIRNFFKYFSRNSIKKISKSSFRNFAKDSLRKLFMNSLKISPVTLSQYFVCIFLQLQFTFNDCFKNWFWGSSGDFIRKYHKNSSMDCFRNHCMDSLENPPENTFSKISHEFLKIQGLYNNILNGIRNY